MTLVDPCNDPGKNILTTGNQNAPFAATEYILRGNDIPLTWVNSDLVLSTATPADCGPFITELYTINNVGVETQVGNNAGDFFTYDSSGPEFKVNSSPDLNNVGDHEFRWRVKYTNPSYSSISYIPRNPSITVTVVDPCNP